mmetsp:Transcript_4662/g.9953  ORF Transcript_4662/g.9953 Transcript_4662/m.9953 type:complete len:202 (-) Transcript_4662:59-664(-)
MSRLMAGDCQQVLGHGNDGDVAGSMTNSLGCSHQAIARPPLTGEEEQGIAGLARLQTFARLVSPVSHAFKDISAYCPGEFSSTGTSQQFAERSKEFHGGSQLTAQVSAQTAHACTAPQRWLLHQQVAHVDASLHGLVLPSFLPRSSRFGIQPHGHLRVLANRGRDVGVSTRRRRKRAVEVDQVLSTQGFCCFGHLRRPGRY